MTLLDIHVCTGCVSICLFVWSGCLCNYSIPVILFAGLFLILGLMLYPAGWGSKKVVDYCGQDASPYKVGLCSLGWAFYTAIGGTVLTFLCAMFSAQAEIATSNDKVQDEIEEGRSLICVLWAKTTQMKETFVFHVYCLKLLLHKWECSSDLLSVCWTKTLQIYLLLLSYFYLILSLYRHCKIYESLIIPRKNN